MHRLLFIFILLLSCIQVHSQPTGEYFALLTKGLSVFRFSEDLIIMDGRRDSIDAAPKQVIDTLTILKRINKGDFQYFVLSENTWFYNSSFKTMSIMKIRVKNPNSFENIISINSNPDEEDDEPMLSVEDAIREIENDTFPYLSITYYSKDSLEQVKNFKAFKSATQEEFISILDTMLFQREKLQEFLNQHTGGSMAGLFNFSPIIRGNIEGASLIKNHFSPFFTRSDFNFLVEKYSKEEPVKSRIDKLEKK